MESVAWVLAVHFLLLTLGAIKTVRGARNGTNSYVEYTSRYSESGKGTGSLCSSGLVLTIGCALVLSTVLLSIMLILLGRQYMRVSRQLHAQNLNTKINPQKVSISPPSPDSAAPCLADCENEPYLSSLCAPCQDQASSSEEHSHVTRKSTSTKNAPGACSADVHSTQHYDYGSQPAPVLTDTGQFKRTNGGLEGNKHARPSSVSEKHGHISQGEENQAQLVDASCVVCPANQKSHYEVEEQEHVTDAVGPECGGLEVRPCTKIRGLARGDNVSKSGPKSAAHSMLQKGTAANSPRLYEIDDLEYHSTATGTNDSQQSSPRQMVPYFDLLPKRLDSESRPLSRDIEMSGTSVPTKKTGTDVSRLVRPTAAATVLHKPLPQRHGGRVDPSTRQKKRCRSMDNILCSGTDPCSSVPGGQHTERSSNISDHCYEGMDVCSTTKQGLTSLSAGYHLPAVGNCQFPQADRRAPTDSVLPIPYHQVLCQVSPLRGLAPSDQVILQASPVYDEVTPTTAASWV
ncbi:uncharacterized protein LOC135811686 [Sycon ciliatum]|uniref:uncharacterized protein LOC135811686 n=1 Tax=Sycon ciliatum TaxID=27933 RepID=UPI0031F6B0D4